jgi:hypothetical protein
MLKAFFINLFAIFFVLNNIHSQPEWKFSVIVGVNKVESDYYGGFTITSMLVSNQFSEVNTHFNSPGVFNGTFNFSMDSIYEFTGNSQNEVAPPPPGYDYRVIIDGVSTGTSGGWYGYPTNTIMHNWSVTSWGGTFMSYGTDALTHEFGHARGAIDLYALQVLADSNRVNGKAFNSDTSLMNSCYGISVWDMHSVNIINNDSDIVLANVNYITSKFPDTIGIRVTDSIGNPLNGVSLKVYPVYWYTYSIDTIPAYSGMTNSSGKYIFSSDPFVPGINGYPWKIKYCNFLVRAIYNQDTVYAWMPVNVVQNSYFADPFAPFFLNMKFDILLSIQENNFTQNIYTQIYPNPINKKTTIQYSIPVTSVISIKIFNVYGQEIETLFDGHSEAGVHKINWDSESFNTGIYFLILETPYTHVTNKFIIAK